MKRLHWHSIRTLFARLPAFDGESVPDGELLERYHRGDSAAFELLVHRHAEAVFGTCGRICRDTHDAEDAFQATFLVLARKAKGLRRSECLAGWLHRVANRAATRAAVKRSRSQQRERSIELDPPTVGTETSDLQSILDAEIDRLTDRFRLPVLLCYLQGLSTEDAAKQLGIPRGTVLSRLATARQKLTTRLTRRGVTVPTTAIGLFGFGAGSSATAITVRSFTVPSASKSASMLAREILHMAAWKTTAVCATVVVAIAGLGGAVWAVAEGGKEGLPVVKAAEKEKPQSPKVETIKPGTPAAAAPPAIELEIRAEADRREKETADKLSAEKKARIERAVQIERLTQLVEELEKRSLVHRQESMKLMLKAGLPEFDPQVLAGAISRIDAERIAAEDEKDQPKSARLNDRRAVLSERLMKQQAEHVERNLRLEMIKREMVRLERMGDDLRVRLVYLQHGLEPVPPSTLDPMLQKLIDEVAELKLEMRKLAEAKK